MNYLIFLENIKNLELSLSAKECVDQIISAKDYKIEELMNQVEKYKEENRNHQENYESLIERNSLLKVELNNLVSDLSLIKIELSDSKQCLEEEKIKNRNLVALIKDLEKKKSNSKVEAECIDLKAQIQLLNTKLIELENKYKGRLEKKDMIIKKLDESLVQYEDQLRNINN